MLRTWRHHRVQPWRAETFKFSTDPELVGKVTDVVGLYLNPPENAIVLSVDEKSRIQALDRTQKTLPMQQWIGRVSEENNPARRSAKDPLLLCLCVSALPHRRSLAESVR